MFVLTVLTLNPTILRLIWMDTKQNLCDSDENDYRSGLM